MKGAWGEDGGGGREAAGEVENCQGFGRKGSMFSKLTGSNPLLIFAADLLFYCSILNLCFKYICDLPSVPLGKKVGYKYFK